MTRGGKREASKSHMRLYPLFVALALTCLCAKGQSKKLNIILILADDLGFSEVGFNGQKKIRTPNLDAMAEAGASMTNFYAGSPVCGPSRSTLLVYKSVK